MEDLAIVLIFVVLYILFENPVLIVLAIVAIIGCCIYASKHPSKGGGSGGSGYVSGNTPNASGSYNNNMGYLYSGSYAGGAVLASFCDGKVYSGYNSGLSTSYIEATYQNGWVYRGTITSYAGTVLGRYENGKIYRGNSTSYSDLIAEYGNGKITKQGGWSQDIVGSYTGNDDGAAAAAIVFLL